MSDIRNAPILYICDDSSYKDALLPLESVRQRHFIPKMDAYTKRKESINESDKGIDKRKQKT